MKKILILTSLLAVALIPGCKPADKEPAAQAANTTAAQQIDQAQAAASKATQQMQDYTFEQKSEFVATMEGQLAELNRSLDELAATIAKSSEAVKTEAKPKLAALREQSAQLKKQLASVTGATSSTWSGIKADSEKAYAELKDSLAQSRQWLSEKIAP